MKSLFACLAVFSSLVVGACFADAGCGVQNVRVQKVVVPHVQQVVVPYVQQQKVVEFVEVPNYYAQQQVVVKQFVQQPVRVQKVVEVQKVQKVVVKDQRRGLLGLRR